MKEIIIKGSLRTETGKRSAKQLRKQEAVPAILYGGKEIMMLAIDEKDVKSLVYTSDVHLINLTIGRKKRKAIIKELQFHPVTDRVLHIDFFEVFDDKKVTIAIPVKLVGPAEGIKQGGKLHVIARRLRVSGYPNDLPEKLEIDITDLTLGKSKMVEDLSFEKIEIVEPKSTVIATVKLTRVSKSDLELEEEGEEAAPEEGTAEKAEGDSETPEAKE